MNVFSCFDGMSCTQKVTIESFGDLIELATDEGWVDNYDEWNCSIAEAMEEDATDFLESKGYIISYE